MLQPLSITALEQSYRTDKMSSSTDHELLDVSQPMSSYTDNIEFLDSMESLSFYKDFDETAEGRKLYFEDGVRRIDYIIAWNKHSKKMTESQNARSTFHDNLKKEFLELEVDTSDSEIHFMKIHAPFKVLCRYAELLKLKVPMKETPELLHFAKQYDEQQVVKGDGPIKKLHKLWQQLSEKLKSPFDYNKEVFKATPKEYKCPFSRDKDYLFAYPENHEAIFSQGMRTRIVDYILRRTSFGDKDAESYSCGIKKMISDGYYVSAFPLHEGHWKKETKPNIRKDLYDNWGHWSQFLKFQPLHYIKEYFGEKVGIYFAWLGFYTLMLIPAAIVGFGITIYGLIIMRDNYVSNEICQSTNITMCPLCDHRCPYWNLSEACSHSRVSAIVDNGATVFFAIFMSFWGTLFLEFWKRKQAVIQWKWNLHYQEEEEPPRPEYLAKMANDKKYRRDPISQMDEPYIPFWTRQIPIICFSYSLMLFMVSIAIAAVLGVIAFRVSMLAALQLREENIIYKNAGLMTTVISACINLLIIMILNIIYRRAAFWLTDLECLRTQTEYDNSLTFKLFALQFVNYYSSIIYIAFFKGKFVGRPGKYNTIFGARQEECEPGGCLIELCIQLGIIMTGKQLLQNNLVEILIPKLWKYCMKRWKEAAKKKLPNTPWEKDLLLTDVDTTTLFYEYLEMILQFGFLTLFVAAFPMGPLFCLINNIIEIRADANKFVTTIKRPTPQIATNIGIWYSVLYGISRIAILSNAFIICVTSDFIPQLVYKIGYSLDDNLSGYVENSLAYFNTSDFEQNHRPLSMPNETLVEICRYRDYRNPPWAENKYEYSEKFWHIFAARMAFVVVFENFVVVFTSIIAWLIPDVSSKTKELIRQEAYITQKIIMNEELKRAREEARSVNNYKPDQPPSEGVSRRKPNFFPTADETA
ncbi:anoctamin-4 isoform X3 [Octopus sinensis]|uniref:Anoctamin n=2 Tax=Octopus TaxID=6643 RepID=A0A7E6FFD7_9MOLL|nr:anoctamin-4 isoform X3 [Octopus sinensis]